MPIRIMTIVGARPQFVKAAVVSRHLATRSDAQEMLVHTGQHFDDNMSAVFFEEMGIPRPAATLAIHSLPHGAMTGRMLEALEREMLERRPDWVLVYGDTNSTLAAALAAAKLHIPVAHVEAGLRSFNRAMPEEINRVLTDHAAELLLTPTDAATARLRVEGIPDWRIVQTGDVMQDAAQAFGDLARRGSTIVARLGLSPSRPVAVCTVHRAENTDDPALMRGLFDALRNLAAEIQVVLPLHPRTRGLLARYGIDAAAPGLHLIEPVGFVDMLRLQQVADIVLTDSGGVQKEAFFQRKPCVTFREQTEWVELVEAGWNVLSPLSAGPAELAATVRAWIGRRGRDVHPYGAPGVAARVVDAICGFDAARAAALNTPSGRP